jgi:hypothetical protein
MYVDLRRKGAARGRFLAFCVGYPGTLISLFVVREGETPRIEPPTDDEVGLLQEIRKDRESRGEREAREAPPEI